MLSLIKSVGETMAGTVATAAAGVATAATLGQVDSVKDFFVGSAEFTASSACDSAKGLVHTGNGLVNGTPGVGHVKGIIHYACGDTEGGDEAMKSASHSVGVAVGAVAGAAGGPAGMVAGGIAGGAYMDAVTTAVESAVKDDFKPSGFIASVTDMAEACDEGDGAKCVAAAAGLVGAMALDGVSGYKSGTGKKSKAKRSIPKDEWGRPKYMYAGGNLIPIYYIGINSRK